MDAAAHGQVTGSAAEVYETFFVPALFGEWSSRVAAAARIQPGDRVLDVACGTGVLARETTGCVGTGGSVVGLDRNTGMLDLAARIAPEIDWVSGRAEDLPFPANEFDAVVSQFGLMFFDDREGALAEMWRVLKLGGRLAVAVWDAADRLPGYAAMIALLDRLFGKEAANALRAPFSLGDPAELRALAGAAGITNAGVETQAGTARFSSLASWVYTDVKGWTLADMIDDAQLETLQVEAQRELDRFVQPDGSVEFAAPAHILTATK